ncbi:SDR family NAD(P)-dependent oxidoreductase [Acinetobacter chinensis]|uniref:SDR family NAD(P)-dependent oxidoreductase n=1 Tax=Acinetobacter chinensis TaxID=2004650 RepID=A0ABU3WH04_9GAMM|nr:SDR family NAD(P)-dependent oxidoreductase [Acinetobacter chinensis]MDV2469328.1 SDR family NAD(P)-dependent oxidoreductase [Acinetobacter chinensis]
MSKKLKILIVGGTSTIAEHCARLWLKNTVCELILIGRDESKLHRVANDLMVRAPKAEVKVETVNFLSARDIQACIQRLNQSEPVDIALIAHGNLPDQENCQNDLTLCQDSIEVNAVSPVLFAEAIISNMIQCNHGKLAVIGSVAGDRGRKSNYIYGASKALIERYVQGLQHRLAIMNSCVSVTLVKPGPTETPMTAGISGKGRLASPEQVAKEIVGAVNAGKMVVYTPGKWFIIMKIIRNLPFFIFRKMDI